MAIASEFQIDRLTVACTLTERVSASLMKLIRQGDFLPGSRLPSELKMASRFGVSRTVIREAVSRLKSEGLVESRQGSGAFVRERNLDSPFRFDPNALESTDSILQVFELRHVLDGEIAALAAKRRTSGQLAAIRQALHKIDSDVSSGGDGIAADIAFHRCIADAIGNPHFLALSQFLGNFLRSVTRNMPHTGSTPTQRLKDDHQAIFEALSRRDSEAARTASRLHSEAMQN
jgi:GntR family transcriptional repressor for pyruvate dehydrogenase complex